MARHFAGGELATYFWGQAYGGSQEVLATVPLFWVAGSGWLTLRLVPIALSAVTAVVVWRVGRRTIGEPAAVVAGCVSWIWPPFVIYKLTHQWGFYASGTLYTGLLLLVTLRMVERPTKMRIASSGWSSGSPSGRARSSCRSSSGDPVGDLEAARMASSDLDRGPARRARRASRDRVERPTRLGIARITDRGHDDVPASASHLRVAPRADDARPPHTVHPGAARAAAVALLVLAGLVALFAYGAYRARRREASLLYVVAACFPLLYALAPATLFSQEPKYLVVLSPVVVLLVAQLASTYWRGVALVGVALVLSVATLHRMDTYFPHGPGATSGRAT